MSAVEHTPLAPFSQAYLAIICGNFFVKWDIIAGPSYFSFMNAFLHFFIGLDCVFFNSFLIIAPNTCDVLTIVTVSMWHNIILITLWIVWCTPKKWGSKNFDRASERCILVFLNSTSLVSPNLQAVKSPNEFFSEAVRIPNLSFYCYIWIMCLL